MNQKLLAALAKKIKKSSHTVFFGGAGVSTDSGIPASVVPVFKAGKALKNTVAK